MGGGYYRYDPTKYELWASMPLVFAFVWFVTSLVVFISKPATDRRIDRAIRQRLGQEARGEPLEPE